MNNSNDLETLHADYQRLHENQQSKIMDHMMGQIFFDPVALKAHTLGAGLEIFNDPKMVSKIKRNIQARIASDPRMTNIRKAGELNPNIIRQ